MKNALLPPRLLTLGAAGLLLAGCSAGSADDTATGGQTATTSAATTVDGPAPRLAVTYDGGVLVLDADTLDVVGEADLDGFLRVNPAGDGRHALVTTEEGFRVLDTGTWTEGGDSYVADPVLTDRVFEAEEAGHVVVHGGRTVLFADGTGDITAFDTDDLRTAEELPETESWSSEVPHHGVAIELTDGRMVATLGTEEERTGARVLDADGTELARSEECPGVHGEGTAAGEVVVFGCEDGVLVLDGEEFTKIAAPDDFGRTGNIFTTDDSSIVVGDYRTDPDAEGYLLGSIVLIDTATATMQVVPLPEGVEYTFRDLGRGPDGEAVVLGSDGGLHLLDETTGELLASYPVIEAWEGPEDWQDAHPTLKILDGIAYVTEPAADALHAVDLATGEVLATGDLGVTPIELAVITG